MITTGAITLEKIYFDRQDFDQSSNSFYKTVHNVEMEANGNLNFRIFIIDKAHESDVFTGRLTIYYGNRESPETLSFDNYKIEAQKSR